MNRAVICLNKARTIAAFLKNTAGTQADENNEDT